MRYHEIKNNRKVITDTETGEVIRTVVLATDKQMRFIRYLEKRLGSEPRKYQNLTVWQATKIIDRLKSKQPPLL